MNGVAYIDAARADRLLHAEPRDDGTDPLRSCRRQRVTVRVTDVRHTPDLGTSFAWAQWAFYSRDAYRHPARGVGLLHL
jgi:hypothetical protein